jgi:glutamate synthase domain-containing protein 1
LLKSFGSSELAPRVVDLVLMLDPEQSDELALEAIKLLFQLARTVERNPTMHDIFKAPSLLRRRKMLFAFQYRLMQAQPADEGAEEVFTDVKGEVCSLCH